MTTRLDWRKHINEFGEVGYVATPKADLTYGIDRLGPWSDGCGGKTAVRWEPQIMRPPSHFLDPAFLDRNYFRDDNKFHGQGTYQMLREAKAACQHHFDTTIGESDGAI
jgi:hypothetical protein